MGRNLIKMNLITKLKTKLYLLMMIQKSISNLYGTPYKESEIKPKKSLIKEIEFMKVIEVTHPIQSKQYITEDVAMAFGFSMACIKVMTKSLIY